MSQLEVGKQDCPTIILGFNIAQEALPNTAKVILHCRLLLHANAEMDPSRDTLIARTNKRLQSC